MARRMGRVLQLSKEIQRRHCKKHVSLLATTYPVLYCLRSLMALLRRRLCHHQCRVEAGTVGRLVVAILHEKTGTVSEGGDLEQTLEEVDVAPTFLPANGVEARGCQIEAMVEVVTEEEVAGGEGGRAL